MSVGYQVYQGQQLQVKAIGQFRFDGFEVDGNTELAGLNDRHYAFDVGLSVKAPNRYCTIEIKYLIDATNTYNGQELGIDFEKVFMFSRSYFVPSVGVSWQSKKLVDYYYGVSSSEATYDMPQYEGDTALNVNIQGMYGYMIDDHSNFILGVQGIVYGDNIYDSPIVDSSLNLNVFAAYLYKF